MQNFVKRPVNYIVKNGGEIVDVTGADNKNKGRVIHIVATKIDDNVVESVKKIVDNKNVKQVVINRTKLWYSPLELKRLKILDNYINARCSNEISGKLRLEFLENSTVYDFAEIKKVNDRLSKEAKIIRNGYVESWDNERRPFSPLEKLFAIHLLVSNNEYKANDFTSSDYTRNLYSVLQEDRNGIVCLGYANWFKELANLVDPEHKEFKVGVVGSFFPSTRKENFDYEKISEEKVYTDYYSEYERAFHATNIVLVNDEVYKVKGVYHNDSTFDSIKPYNKNKSFLHFMWPFGGYMKSDRNFIPLRILHPSLSQAKALSNLIFVDNAQLDISRSYLEFLKYPKKKVYIKQRERTYKILSSQISRAKDEHLMLGKEYCVRKNSKENVYEEHDYNSWEEAIREFIRKNTKIYKDNNEVLKYVKHTGVLPDVKSLDDERFSELKIFIMSEGVRNAKKEIIKNFETKEVDQNSALKDFILRNNQIREKDSIKTINNDEIKQILPDIHELYKADADEILRIITMQPWAAIQKYIILPYLRSELSQTEFGAEIDNVISNGKIKYNDVAKAKETIERDAFKRLQDDIDTDEINYDAMRKIRKNVKKYLETLEEEKLKESNFDLSRLEERNCPSR